MKNIVTIGGGTGSYTVLKGLKHLKGVSLTALVSMADSGGSTGLLRDEYGVLPPGDVRQCLVALSEDTAVVREVMNYRYNEGPYEGLSFGNLFLTTLEKVTGDFAAGVEIASEIMKIKGTVVPITKDSAELQVQLDNKKILDGEATIEDSNLQKAGVIKVFYKTKVRINPHAKKAIEEADYIVLGPGDFYTSLMPIIIVKGFREALLKTKAKIIFPINLTNKPGHTMGWRASDFVHKIEDNLSRSLDYIIINTEKPSPDQLRAYKKDYDLRKDEEILVQNDLLGKKIIKAKLLSHRKPKREKGDKLTRSFIRHDHKKLASTIEQIIRKR